MSSTLNSSTETTSLKSNSRWASPSRMKAHELSYSKKPELKIPATLKRLYLGTTPNGVSSPCGLVTVMTEPTVAPSSSDMSLPRMIGGREEPASSELLLLADAGASSAAAEP